MPFYSVFNPAIICWNRLLDLVEGLFKAGDKRRERPFLALNYSIVGLIDISNINF